MEQLSSAVLIVSSTEQSGFFISGHAYVWIDGRRQVIALDAYEIPGSIHLTAVSRMELLMTAAIEQLRKKLARGDYTESPEPVAI
jgi:hypothetical protein